MTGVGEDGLILHDGEVTGGDDVLTAGGGDKEVAHLGGLVHGHDPIAVHGGVQGFERVDLRDDDIGAHALGTHGHALAAPAVAGDHDSLAGDDQVGGVHDGGHDRLAGAVFVVIVVLGLGIVDGHHGAGKDTLPFPRLQAQDAGGSLLTAANEAVAQLLAAAADEVDEIAAVVHDQVGVARQGFHQQVFVLLRSDAVDAIGIHAHAGDACGHIVLGGQGITAGQVDFCAPLGQHQTQIGGLGFQVDGDGDAETGEGLFPFEPFLNGGQGGHEGAHPLDLGAAGFGQGHIFDNAHGV